MTLKVIGAGLGRTGTLSLKFALEHLGFGPCHHMAEVFCNTTEQLPKWLGVVNGRPDWDAVFDGYESAVDYPACTYWRELADKYPEAKIILSVRDPESWFNSATETIFSPHMLARVTQEPLKPFFEGAVIGDFGDRITDKAFMIDYFQRRNEEVVAIAPRDRLLVFEAKQGWEPLCAFLGVPVPDIPYPRVNGKDEMAARMTNVEARAAREKVMAAPGPEAMMEMARAHLEHQRQKALGGAPA
ncbi:MAG: hypothetical protein J7494_07185 [Sphingobium sp.]|nr:hypothetical protein [Sphingobium sp.]